MNNEETKNQEAERKEPEQDSAFSNLLKNGSEKETEDKKESKTSPRKFTRRSFADKGREAAELTAEANSYTHGYLSNPTMAPTLLNEASYYGNLSLHNAALVMKDRGIGKQPEAMKTYQGWQKAGYQVRRNQHGIRIVEPLRLKSGRTVMTPTSVFPVSATNAKKEDIAKINQQQFKAMHPHVGYASTDKLNEIAQNLHLQNYQADPKGKIKDNVFSLVNEKIGKQEAFRKDVDPRVSELKSVLVTQHYLQEGLAKPGDKSFEKTNEDINSYLENWRSQDGKALNELTGKQQARIMSDSMRTLKSLDFATRKAMDKDFQEELQTKKELKELNKPIKAKTTDKNKEQARQAALARRQELER